MGLIDLLIRHEGIKLKPYHCTSGKLTIGIGRNLEDRGITKEEAIYLLNNDNDLASPVFCFKSLSINNQLNPSWFSYECDSIA